MGANGAGCGRIYVVREFIPRGENAIFEKKVLDLNRACHMVMESEANKPETNPKNTPMKNSFTHPSTPIFGYLYGSSRVDGLPIHPPVAWATPVEFTVQEVLQWHLSKQHGDSRWFLGADLSDGRQVWLIRSHQNPVTSKHLNTVADSIHKNRKGFRGNPNSMLFIYDETPRGV